MATGGVNESISDILENVITDQSLESLADTLATKFGLSFKNSTTQTAVYTLSTVATLEIAQNLFEIGAGFTSLDLTGFTLAQIKRKLEIIEQKLNIILGTPIKLAVEYFSTAMTLMECGDIERTVAEMNEVRHQAMQSYQYAIQEQKWEQAVLAKKLKIMSTIILYSADKKTNTIVPFDFLKDESKKKIAAVIESDVIDAVELPKKIKSERWLPMSDKRKDWAQNLANEILKPTYQYLSHGFSWSNPRSHPFDWKCKGYYLPVGKESKAPLSILIDGKMEQLHLWRDKKEKDGSFKIHLTCDIGHVRNSERLLSLEALDDLQDLKADLSYPIRGWNNEWINPRCSINEWKFRARYLPQGRENMATLSVEKNGKMEPVHIWIEKGWVSDYYIYVECANDHTQCLRVWEGLDRVVTWSDVNTSCCDTRHQWTQVNVESHGKIRWKVGAYKRDKTWYLPIYLWDDGGGPVYRNKTNSSSSRCPVHYWQRRLVDTWEDADHIRVYCV